MIQLNIQAWELAVLLIAIAFIWGTVNIVKALKNLAAVLDEANKLMIENRSNIGGIIKDAKGITKSADFIGEKATHIVAGVDDTVTSFKSSALDPLLGAVIGLRDKRKKGNTKNKKTK